MMWLALISPGLVQGVSLGQSLSNVQPTNSRKINMPCPICDKETDEKYKPFCSGRCADLDLGKWLNESYRVPSNAPEDIEEAQKSVETSGQDTGEWLH